MNRRQQRFRLGDTVEIVRGGTTGRGRIYRVEHPEVDASMGSPCGLSAKYWIVGHEWPIWDWMVERPASLRNQLGACFETLLSMPCR